MFRHVRSLTRPALAFSLGVAGCAASPAFGAGLCLPLLINTCVNEVVAGAGSALPATAWNMQFNAFNGLDARLESLRTAPSGTGLRPTSRMPGETGMAAAGDAAPRHGIWGRAFASQDSQNARDNFSGYASRGGGLALGYDYALSPAWTIGASLTLGENRLRNEQQAVGQTAKTQSAQLAGLVSRNIGRGYVNFMASYARQQYDLARGTAGGTASAAFDGDQSGARLDGGVRLPLGERFALTPMARLDYGRIRQFAYTESGGNTPLSVGERKAERWRSALGAQLTYNTTLGNTRAEPYASVFWNHDFKTQGVFTTAAFANGLQAGGQGAPIPRNTYSVGLGSTFALSGRLFALLGYDFEGGGGYKANGVKLVVRYNY